MTEWLWCWKTRINSFALLFDAHRTCLFDLCQTKLGKHALDAPPVPGPKLDEHRRPDLLQALSDPVRLEIVRQLAGCELKCGQVQLPVTKSTASRQLQDPARRRGRRRAGAGHEQVPAPAPRRARRSGSRGCSTRCCARPPPPSSSSPRRARGVRRRPRPRLWPVPPRAARPCARPSSSALRASLSSRSAARFVGQPGFAVARGLKLLVGGRDSSLVALRRDS